jgi:Zn-dependent protease
VAILKLLVLLLTTVKLGKLLLTGGTMLLSLAVYAMAWGWRFAAGFVALLFFHEMGHYVAARQRGLNVSAPAFIPFMGAFITLRDTPHNAETEAYVAFAGPFIGTLATFAVYFWASDQGSHLWLAVAYSGFFLNLFNLLPISPLDGGRITAVLGPRIWLLGAPLLLGLLLWRPSPMLLVVAVIAFPQLIKAWKYDPNAPENLAYYGVGPQAKFEYATLYLGLVAVLGLMTHSLHTELEAYGTGQP